MEKSRNIFTDTARAAIVALNMIRFGRQQKMEPAKTVLQMSFSGISGIEPSVTSDSEVRFESSPNPHTQSQPRRKAPVPAYLTLVADNPHVKRK